MRVRNGLWRGIALLMVITVVATGCGGDSESDDAAPSNEEGSDTTAAEGGDGETIMIGYDGELTGDGAASFGIPVSEGIQLAVDEINESGFLGDDVLDVTIKDNATDLNIAVTTFNEFVGDEVPVVLSGGWTPVTRALVEIANQSKTLYISAGNAGTGDPDVEDFYFHGSEGAGPHRAIGQYLASNFERVGVVIAADNAAFPNFAKSIEDGMKEEGSDGYVTSQTIALADVDFSSVLTNLRDADIDALAVITVPAQVGNIIRQAVESGGFDDVQFAGHLGWTTQVVDVAGDAAFGAILPVLWVPGTEGGDDFVDAYQEAYDKPPTQYAALGYDATWALAVSIKTVREAGGTVTGESLRTALPDAYASEEFQQHNLIKGGVMNATGAPTLEGHVGEFSADGIQLAG